MLINLVSTESYGSYNIQLANMLGLETAVYLNELLNINGKAIRKNALSDCFFTLDRDYVKSVTTLDTETQIGIDEKLIELGILSRKDDLVDTIKVDTMSLVALMQSEDDDLKSAIEKLAKIKTKKSKTESLSTNLKRFVNSGNQQLDDLLKSWVEEVVTKLGRFNKVGVIDGQDKLIKFAEGDLLKAIEVVKIATINGYKDMDWAINTYKEKHKDEKHLTIFGQNVNINPTLKF